MPVTFPLTSTQPYQGYLPPELVIWTNWRRQTYRQISTLLPQSLLRHALLNWTQVTFQPT
jgi:hypothetical protein